MKIEKIKLHNFRSAKAIELNFTNQLNLFIGVNGAGKSTILDALSICLSWLVKRIEIRDSNGTDIPDSSIRRGEDDSYLDMNIAQMNDKYSLLLTKIAKGKLSSLKSKFEEISELADEIKQLYSEDISWPVIAYYPVNRVVTVRPSIPAPDSEYNLAVYENALDGKTNYQEFFEWFRQQDDIWNEASTSKARWMRQNRNWIKQRVYRLFELLENITPTDKKHCYQEDIKPLVKRFEQDGIIYEEPQFIFSELAYIIDLVIIYNQNGVENQKNEVISRAMRALCIEFKTVIYNENNINEELGRIIHIFVELLSQQDSDSKSIDFLWETFGFTIALGWELSHDNRLNLDNAINVLRSLNIADFESSNDIVDKITITLQQIIKQDMLQVNELYPNEGQELHIVTAAIERFVPEYSNLRVKRVPHPHMLIDKRGTVFNLDQLSDGEKSIIALVGDIARRLTIANPKKEHPLDGEGVVLIDEIDLHLHPSWQRLVVPKLLETFPNCQFFISTHSPQVVSHVTPESVFLIEQNAGILSYHKADETYGMSLDRIVELVMNDESRPEDVKIKLDEIFELIERKKLTEAKKIILSLKQEMKTDPEIMRAEMLIRQMEMMK